MDDGKEFSVDGVSTNGKFHSDPSFFQRLLLEQNHCEYRGGTRSNKPHDDDGIICSLIVTKKFKFKGSFSKGKFDHNGCLSLYRIKTDEYLMSAIDWILEAGVTPPCTSSQFEGGEDFLKRVS
jgi:hypothetical protein